MQYSVKDLDYEINAPILIVKNEDHPIIIKHFTQSRKICTKLYELGKEYIGPETRFYRELSEIQIDNGFLKALQKQLSNILTEMGSGKLQKLETCKLFIYGPDDFSANLKIRSALRYPSGWDMPKFLCNLSAVVLPR